MVADSSGEAIVKSWEWECFEELVTSQTHAITDCGPLYGPITSFSFTRDENLKLLLETTSGLGSTTSLTPLPAGTVYCSTDQVKFESQFGSTAVAQGVIPLRLQGAVGRNLPQGARRETSSVHAFEWHIQSEEEPHYVIEWLENVSGDFIWPDSIEEKSIGETQRILRSQKAEIVFAAPIDSKEWRRTCAHLSVEGMDLFIGASKNVKVANVSRPGFILYKGNPGEGVRRRIRDCLSFSLGTYLIYLGYTSFNENSEPISFKAVSAYALSKDDQRLLAMPPAPLGETYEWEIAAEKLERMASSLSAYYDTYNFQSVFWAYWHAVAAPIHMSAVHYGAAIESLQSACFKNSAAPINRLILDKGAWDKLAQEIGELEKHILVLDASLKEKELLTNKLKKLNDAPQDVIMGRFLDALNIQIDEVEKSAWKNRNRAAHGGSVNDAGAIKVIRENEALRVLMNRILLAIVNGSNCYYDYFTLGRPIACLANPIPKN